MTYEVIEKNVTILKYKNCIFSIPDDVFKTLNETTLILYLEIRLMQAEVKQEISNKINLN